MLAFVLRLDQRATTVELIDDLEDDLVALLRRRARHEQSPDPEMHLGAHGLRNQRVGRLLDPIMGEPIPGLSPLDQLQKDPLPQSGVDLRLRGPEDDRKQRDLGAVAEAGELLECRLRLDRQTAQFPNHELNDIAGVTLRVNAIEIPGPTPLAMIEDEQLFLRERRQKLNREKRIAAGLLMHQLRERRGARRFGMESIGKQPCHVVTGKGRKGNLVHRRSRLTDRVELAHERMGGTDFVVPVGPDQHQVAHVRLGQQVFDEIQGGRVEPLQVVEEQRQRMFRAREDSNEAPEHELKPALRVLWRQLGDRRRLSDDEFHFGNQVHDESCVRAQRLLQGVAPSRQLRFALPEERTDQTLKGLCQR